MREFREQTVAEFDRTERALFARISSIENELALLSNSAASFVKAVKNLNSMQTQTKDLVERNNRDIRVLRKRVTSEFKQRVESDLNDLKLLSREMLRATFEVSLILGQNPPDVISMDVAKRLLDDYITSGDIVRTQPLLEYFDLQDDLSVTDLRTIYRGLRAAGYWGQALKVLRVVARKSRRENDVRAIAKIEHEISAYSCNDRDVPDFPEGSCYDPEGPILHMVGRVLPDTQTGYTLRTHYTATAQARKGLPVAIVGQPGITDRNLKETERYTHQGIDYYLLPGPSRKEALLDEWLVSAVKNVALLVQQLRPSILHAQSDFFNALIAQMVGKEYGIPTVYESRGFWEESWLSRTITAQGWGANAEEIFQKYSLPDAYILRKRAEEIVRQRADHVFTLAEVMQNHILESADGAIEPQQSLLSRTP
ncbi:glycosyltransferase [Arthrobacter sp. JCM 19049]|uniref:glycosyltransferase n=1 Tax=Arthrobacter sp. JCM 19049 TaxID=1460643 RepID=UPI0006D1F375|nr:glycosyltransferase [Arthrobacter sp. JCM 19049]